MHYGLNPGESKRRASRGGRRGRGGVFDLPMGVGRFYALRPLRETSPIRTEGSIDTDSDTDPDPDFDFGFGFGFGFDPVLLLVLAPPLPIHPPRPLRPLRETSPIRTKGPHRPRPRPRLFWFWICGSGWSGY